MRQKRNEQYKNQPINSRESANTIQIYIVLAIQLQMHLLLIKKAHIGPKSVIESFDELVIAFTHMVLQLIHY